jgi:hypothetical protein
MFEWKSTNAKKARQAKSKVKFMFGDCSQRICHGRSNSRFRILLWLLMATPWKYAKISSRAMMTRELAVASRIRFLFHQRNFYQKQYGCRLPPALLAWLGTLWFFSVSPFDDTVILTQLKWSRQNRGRCLTLSENTTSNMHLRNSRHPGNGAYSTRQPRLCTYVSQ